MSQQYDYLPPPPPRSPGSPGMVANVSPGARPSPVPRRRPASSIMPPTLATNLLGTPGGLSAATTPLSAVTYAGSHQQAFSPMEPYDPRHWTQRGHVPGPHSVFHQRSASGVPNTTEMSGLEAAMPSPPPPYTPNNIAETARRAAGHSPMAETHGYPASSLGNDITTRQSPQQAAPTAFPPPPAAASSRNRERSSSGMAGQRILFGLTGLRGKQPVVADAPAIVPTIYTTQLAIEARPPAARRAASTGHMGTAHATASSSAASLAVHGRSSPESAWQPGMPLPGPPPGPPPAGHRSQSLNRTVGASGSSSSSIDAQRPRKAHMISTLGPVPPTPADWVNASPNPTNLQMDAANTSGDMEPLRIDTSGHRESSLTRRPAQRGDSASGLRDRRSRSRAAKGSDEGAGPSNLVFSPIEGAISRRREHARTGSIYADQRSAPNSGNPLAPGSANNVLTPPYSPAGDDPLHRQIHKVLGSDRPPSRQHLSAAIETNGMMPAPLSPGRMLSKPSTAKLDGFALQAIERHRAFVEKELAAGSDEERLELFANYLVHESRVRRDRYNAAYSSMAGEIVDMTRDMWRSYNTPQPRRAGTPSTALSSYDPTVPSWASDGRPGSARHSSFGENTPATENASEDGEHGERTFKPSLSPIPSMAVSTVPDEDSRGRAPSRWWEQSASGSGSIGRPERIEKSRRETKYMGVTPATLKEPDHDTKRVSNGSAHDYPPEKVGWHESRDYDTPLATPQRLERHPSSTGSEPLDGSRLVTLPPPYPRHHPALSNNHPLLADLRSQHRILAAHDEIVKIKDVFRVHEAGLLLEQQEAATQRRAKLRNDIQSKIANGGMSYADAAKAEADFEVEEAERAKAAARSNFDVFEHSVSHPLNTLLTKRLSMADACIQQLTADLESGDYSSDPDQTQEEGDERPERLEKLTLLKWLFEAREQLHKEMFDLHGMRSDQYAEVILTPYRVGKQQSKIDEANAFFRKDACDRQTTFAREAVKRYEALQALFDKNVTRGVEDQLSAFWDIAPGLLGVVQAIPADMSSVTIAIPAQEYDENPSYHRHPLQYLYTLLGHAQKSAYQFIESQTNLLCLLHEVKTATTKASLRVIEMEAAAASPDDPRMRDEMQRARLAAESQLTADLKEKVGEVERQWKEALGDGMAECKAWVGAWLEAHGGLEDGLDV